MPNDNVADTEIDLAKVLQDTEERMSADSDPSPESAPSDTEKLDTEVVAEGNGEGDTTEETEPAVTGEEAAAATEQTPQDVPVDDTTKRGFIPTARHEQAVKNAREKGKEEARQELSWATKFTPEQVERIPNVMRTWEDMNTNPVDFTVRLIREIHQGGMDLAPIRALFGAAPAAVTENSDLELPDADLVNDKGEKVAYSVKAMKAFADKLTGHVLSKLGPDRQYIQARREQDEKTAAEQAKKDRAITETTETLTEAQASWPKFTENFEDIRNTVASMDQKVRQRLGVYGTLRTAYLEVLAKKVYPGTQQQAESKVLANLQRKARTSNGSATPNGAAGPGKGTPKDAEMSEDELAKTLERRMAVSS